MNFRVARLALLTKLWIIRSTVLILTVSAVIYTTQYVIGIISTLEFVLNLLWGAAMLGILVW